MSFLAEASRLLADSLDYETTLSTVAGLSLPYLGAWCIVDVCIDGTMRRAVVIHVDPDLQALARKLESGWPPEREDPFGVPRAMRTRETEIIADIPDEMLIAVSRSEENLQILRTLGMGSLLMVPLQARGEVLGAITYVSPSGGRAHGERDVALVEDLAARCAIALDNARLYRNAQEAREGAEAAQARAEEANGAKTNFLSTMSHELCAPLNAISAYVDILQMGVHGPLTEKQAAHLRRIQASQRHLHALVNQVLEFAQLGVHRMKYDLADVALRDVTEHVSALVAPLADQRKVSFGATADCTGADLTVHADPEKLAQIVVNLLSNAIKFTPSGGRVELRCEAEDERVCLRVRDTGMGIAAADQERIFEPFVQASQGLTRTAQGTGLGLAISRELARAMGGDITLESVPGEGSTFTLRLPRRNGTAIPQAT